MSSLSEYILPNRKGRVEVGFDSENVVIFSGRSRYPKINVKSNTASIHFFDELEKISNYKLSGGDLEEDIRTDRYIWGILDEVYQDDFEVIATCNSSESWTGTTDDTENQRFGDACKKLTLNGTGQMYVSFTSKDLSSRAEIAFYLYIEDMTAVSALEVQLAKATGGTNAFTYDLTGLEQGWNAVSIPLEDFTTVGTVSWADITMFIITATTTSEIFFLVDVVRGVDTFYPERLFDVGIQDIGVAWWAGNTALYEIKTACEAEGAMFFANEEGSLMFRNRQHYNTTDESKVASWGFDFDNSTDMEYEGDIDKVINKIIFRIRPREIVSEKEIWRYSFTPAIEASETKTIWAEFVDPCPTTSSGIVSPVSTTDYTANSQADGGGTDKTSDISISITKFSTGAKLEVTNNDTSTVYLTLLKLRGTPAERKDETRVVCEDATSIGNYGVVPSGGLTVDNKYIVDEDYAEILGDQIIEWYKDPRRRIELKGRAAPHLQLGDMISIKNANTGIEHIMRIIGIINKLNEADGLSQEIFTRIVNPFELLSFFEVGTSDIEGDDVISP